MQLQHRFKPLYVSLVSVVVATLLLLGTTENFSYLLTEDLPPGQRFYVLSKWSALTSVLLLCSQIILVAMSVHNSSVKRLWTVNHHKLLAIMVAIFAILHVVLFFVATSIRAGHANISLFVPNFNSGYYNTMTSLGAIGLYVGIVGYVFGVLQKREYGKALPNHRFAMCITVLLITVHSFTIGSESAQPAMMIVYVFLLAAVAGLFVYRFKK